MLKMERRNEALVRKGLEPRKLSPAWTERPRLNCVDQHIFHEFLRFAAFCGGEVDPTKALSWFEMNGVPSADRPWLGSIYATLAPVLRESDEHGGN